MADFITEIRERRILPAVGVYAAGCWVLIEILDRLVERYLLSPYLTDIVFWGLYTLIPAVILVAWSYGRPGKDQATTAQKVGVPINLIATAGLLITFFGGKDLSAAADKVTLANEEGQVETHYIPRDAYRRRMAVYFFDNDSGDADLDWLQYAVTELLVQDLQQDPFVSAISPWANWGNGLYSRMRKAGFTDGLDVPRSLMREITDQANRQYFVEGGIDRVNDEFRITARVWNAQNMELVREIERTGWDLYTTVDGLSRSIREALDVPDAGRIAQDLPLTETYGESEDALRRYIEGLNARLFDNDVVRANDQFRQATELDPNFVMGWFTMALNQVDGGDLMGAQQSLQKAQALDYRLPDRDRAVLKRVSYRLAGETAKMIEFMKMQVQLRDDASSHYALATMLMYTGELQEAKHSFLAALERDPLNTGIYINLALLDRSTENLEGAIGYASRYQEQRPEDDQALMLLGDLFRDSGDLSQAAAQYRRAQLLAEPPVAPLLRLADLAAREGDTNKARQLIEQASEVAESPVEHLGVHGAAMQLELRLGRPDAAIEQVLAQRTYAEQALPPVSVALSINAQLVGLNIEMARYEEAHAALEEGKAILQPPLDQFLALAEAVLLMKEGDLDAADRALQQGAAIIEQFDFDPLRFQLDIVQAQILSERGQLEEAAGLMARGVDSARRSIIGGELSTQLPMAYAAQAELEIDAGLLETAEETVNRGLLLDPNQPLLWLEKARYQQARGLSQLAQASVQYALAIWKDADPDYRSRLKADALLESLRSDPS